MTERQAEYFSPQPKRKPYRNPDYLRFVRSQPCLKCGMKAQAHHVRRYYWGSSMGKRPHDYVTIPLCAEHHTPEVEKYLDIERIIIGQLMEYVESKRGG